MPPSFHIIRLTPPGRGAIATLLVEGPGAVGAVEAEFRDRGGRTVAGAETDRPMVGHFGLPPGEEVVVRRSGPEAVEVHCHGGQAAVDMIGQRLAWRGGTVAAWQQWAERLEPDPIAAAAQVALADARTLRTAAILLDQYRGALSRAMAAIRRLLDGGQADAARRQIEVLLGRAPLGRHLTCPWRVILAGRTNVGKSSLLNALAGFPRAIVHPTPGTTRDVVALRTALDGWPVELSDTAGLGREAEVIERAGIELARRRLAEAELVVLVFDRSLPWGPPEEQLLADLPRSLVVHNKSDLPDAGGRRPGGLRTSAVGRDGIDELAAAVVGRLVPDPPQPGDAIPFSEEQVRGLVLLAREAGRQGPWPPAS
jgi:tRNA modification GTPase